MKPADFGFLASALLVLVLLVRAAIAVFRRRWAVAGRMARILAIFVGGYALILLLVGLAMPRRTIAPAERECFDDWCIAAISATLEGNTPQPPGSSVLESDTWVATVEISSVAKRVRQRAREVRVELQDEQGRLYLPCATPTPQSAEATRRLTDELGPGESFQVRLRFQIPRAAKPAGLVVHHGEYPEKFIIGSDQSALHCPTLLQLATQP